MNVPTGPYRVQRPNTLDAEPYLPWLIDRAVRVGRDNGYSNIVDDAIVLVLADFGVRKPAGGFVDSDGRNANGVLNGVFGANGRDANGRDRQGRDRDGFNANGVNANGQTREQVVEAMVDGWDTETAAAVMTQLAGRVE